MLVVVVVVVVVVVQLGEPRVRAGERRCPTVLPTVKTAIMWNCRLLMCEGWRGASPAASREGGGWCSEGLVWVREQRHPRDASGVPRHAALIPPWPQNTPHRASSRTAEGQRQRHHHHHHHHRHRQQAPTPVSFACWMSLDVNCIPGVGTACVGGDHGRPRSMQIKSNCSPYWVFPAVRNLGPVFSITAACAILLRPLPLAHTQGMNIPDLIL
ncbi:hypothetical protein E2C01_046282 [Portunus trituberculatus]|uniref:Secreted protein n=1 Tax=Portunus trituberculatus TaxID=210409 RepID=A0A5B7G598_PORTR|nr:hypothetical protein [Portunus trituberculatus]